MSNAQKIISNGTIEQAIDAIELVMVRSDARTDESLNSDKILIMDLIDCLIDRLEGQSRAGDPVSAAADAARAAWLSIDEIDCSIPEELAKPEQAINLDRCIDEFWHKIEEVFCDLGKTTRPAAE